MKYDLKGAESGLSPPMCTGTYFLKRQTDESSEETIRSESVANVFTEGSGCDQPEGHSRENLCPNGDIKPTVATQVFASLMMEFMQLSIGLAVAFSGITLPQLTNPDTDDLFLTPLNQALYGSLVFLGLSVGCCVVGPVMMSLGHRITFLLIVPISVAFWFLLAFSPRVWVLLTSRVLIGFTIGVTSSATVVYVIEIAHQDIRRALSGFLLLSRQVGILLTSVVGISNLSWREMGYLYICVTAIPFFGLIFLPNSPRWLVTRGRVSDAEKALYFFRGKHYDFQPELKAIVEQSENSSRGTSNYWQQLRIIKEPSVYRIFCLMSFLILCVAFDGSYSLTAYLVPIFKTMKTSLDPYTCSIIFGVVRLVGTFFFLCVTDRLGRRPLIIVSYCVCAVCLAACGGYFYMQESGSAAGLEWLPLSTVYIFIFFVGTGQPIVIVLSGELMPTSFRAVGFSMLNLVAAIGMFAASMTYPATAETLGQHGAFWVFSVVCGTLALVSTLALPETRGRTLEDILGHRSDEPVET
ncbi:facilitated trehalose transporter Tret1-2 homolog [Procambarus clarkii]|uniref:facilitated trehalose transporter Tret1-2 homolog n=1 Tax=Procambarus clarkii TaxID=6728 RepID=UPI0037449B9A